MSWKMYDGSSSPKSVCTMRGDAELVLESAETRLDARGLNRLEMTEVRVASLYDGGSGEVSKRCMVGGRTSSVKSAASPEPPEETGQTPGSGREDGDEVNIPLDRERVEVSGQRGQTAAHDSTMEA